MSKKKTIPPSAVDDAECRRTPELLSRVTDRWTMVLIGNLSKAPLRYKELQRRVSGISTRMLTFTLRSLERDGLVRRTVFEGRPLRVDYALTPLGHTLIEALQTLNSWAATYEPQIAAARIAFDRAGVDREPRLPRAG